MWVCVCVCVYVYTYIEFTPAPPEYSTHYRNAVPHLLLFICDTDYICDTYTYIHMLMDIDKPI